MRVWCLTVAQQPSKLKVPIRIRVSAPKSRVGKASSSSNGTVNPIRKGVERNRTGVPFMRG